MNKWMLATFMLGMLVIAGIGFVIADGGDPVGGGTCSGGGCPNAPAGGCSSGNNCGNSGCPAANGGGGGGGGCGR